MPAFVLALAAIVAQGTAAQPPRFRTGVDVVQVAVVAKDAAGNHVTDLSSSEFEVLEDGVAQRVVAFTRVSLPIFRPPLEGATPARAAAPADVGSNESVASARIFVLVLDALHVAPVRTVTVRQQARQFIEQHVGPGDLAAVFSPGGPASATADFTNDRARLLAAVDSFTSSKLTSAVAERAEEIARAESTGIVVHGGKDPSDGERAGRAQALTATLEALARHLDRAPGRRKALLLFSEGIDYDTSDVMGEAQRYASDVMHSMDRAVNALMRTNVAMYSIDPRGLGSGQGELIATPVYSRRPGDPDVLSERDVELEQERAIRGLRDLAVATGGFLATDLGLARAFDRIAAESSEYYVIGYTPSKPSKPGDRRKIVVRISRPGVTVLARRGYVVAAAANASTRPVAPLPDDLAPAPIGRPGRPRNSPLGVPAAPESPRPVAGVSAELTELLASPLPAAGLGLRVQAVPFKGDRSRRDVQIVLEVLGRTLRLEERDGRAEERIELAMVTVDDRGRASNGRSTTIEMRLPRADIARVKSTGVRWLSKLDLAPGRHQIRIAARAVTTGASGLVTHVVDVPRFDPDRLFMSGVTVTSIPSVLMVTRGKAWLDESLSTPPSAGRTFVAGDQLTAAVELHVPKNRRVEASVVAEIGAPGQPGQPIAARPGSDASASSREVAFPIDTRGLPPGAYVLRVTATGAGERIEHAVPFDIVSPRR